MKSLSAMRVPQPLMTCLKKQPVLPIPCILWRYLIFTYGNLWICFIFTYANLLLLFLLLLFYSKVSFHNTDLLLAFFTQQDSFHSITWRISSFCEGCSIFQVCNVQYFYLPCKWNNSVFFSLTFQRTCPQKRRGHNLCICQSPQESQF